MELFREFFKVIKALNEAGVEYAVVGGVALAFHSMPRLTRDIDILEDPSDLNIYKGLFASLGYIESAPPIAFENSNLTLHRFVKPSETQDSELIIVNLLLGKEEVHRDIVKRSVLPSSSRQKVISPRCTRRGKYLNGPSSLFTDQARICSD